MSTDVDAFFKELKAISKTTNNEAESDKKKGRTIDIPFHLMQVGKTGEFDIIPIQNTASSQLLLDNHLHSSEYPLPSSISPLKEVEERYLTDLRQNLPSLQASRRFWPREVFNSTIARNASLYKAELSSARTTIEIITNQQTGEVIGFQEIPLAESDSTPHNSMSLLRQPGNREDFTRGSTENYPFLPGGIDRPTRIPPKSIHIDDPNQSFESLLDTNNLLDTPPGFSHSVSLDTPSATQIEDIEDFIKKSEAASKAKMTANPIGLLSEYVEGPKYEDTTNIDYQKAITQTREEARKQIVDIKDVFKDIGVVGDDLGSGAQLADDDESEEEPETKSVIQDSVPSVSEETFKAAEATPLKRSDSLDDLLSQDADWINILAKQRKKESNKKKEEQWAIMESMDMSRFHDLVPNMAMEYPFELDQFQKEAVYHLENNESVFVAAHTSAGKTVVAEYAIALATKHMTRAIYTSPIKALSNQKFRDFKKTFGDVGLITGDVSIHPEASCLIMTTEILRSMLYRGADLIRDVEWVIFDEVHYVNDVDRGVVWEEVIIMLPAHVNLILLSATVPNTYEFADWIGRTKKKKIYVISTMKRPVPLEHYLYTTNDFFKVVDSQGNFLNGGYRSACTALKQKTEKSKAKYQPSAATRSKQDQSEWYKLVNQLKEKSLLPVVVFAFSRKKCEECAYGLTNVDLTNASEKSQIHIFIEQSIARLKGTDKKLPQVVRIKELLKRGLGVHHGGLLPIIKEMVEILFSRGLVKVLFATETFAMGVNMPTRTVVFNSIQKHDGRNFRELLSGEYIQMSGRAGRRGLDTVGTVIISCWGEVPEASTLHTMILGRATKLESQFRLTYNMILNLLRIEDFKVEDMIKRSFSEFSTQRLLPEQQKLLTQSESKLKSFEVTECIFGEPDIENFHSLHSEARRIESDLQRTIINSRSAVQSLVAGRILIVNTKNYPNSMATVIKVGSSESRSHFASNEQSKNVTVAVLCNKSQNNNNSTSSIINPRITVGNDINVVDIQLPDITRLCKNKIKVDTGKLSDKNPDKTAISAITQQLIRLVEENPMGPPEIDPIKELKINDLDFAEKYSRRNILLQKMTQSKCLNCPKLTEQYEAMDKYSKLKKKIHALKFTLSDENLQLMPEFQTRLSVLRKLNYIDENNTVLIKGRVAREINTVNDELIATELIFENVLTPLSPAEIVSVLSTLMFEEKDSGEPTLTERLEDAKDHILNIATSLANIQIDCGLSISVQDYVKTVNPNLMEVVYEWARQMPFSDITQLTNSLEGTIVRTITRLDETCREVAKAARIIGDSALYAKMEQASQMIKRDIVFASSLYVA